MLGTWRQGALKTRQFRLGISATRNCKRLLIACPSAPSNLACTTATRCLRAEAMSERGINALTDVALFLPFSCNEKRQTATNRCKAKTLEVVEKIKKTVRYG